MIKIITSLHHRPHSSTSLHHLQTHCKRGGQHKHEEKVKVKVKVKPFSLKVPCGPTTTRQTETGPGVPSVIRETRPVDPDTAGTHTHTHTPHTRPRVAINKTGSRLGISREYLLLPGAITVGTE